MFVFEILRHYNGLLGHNSSRSSGIASLSPLFPEISKFIRCLLFFSYPKTSLKALKSFD